MSAAKLHRRSFLRGLGLFGAAIRIPLPPLACMFSSNGTAYAADATTGALEQSRPTRFVYWFNGNGIPERYWIPLETGTDYTMTPCLSPLARFRDDIHVVSGLDNPNGRTSGAGNAHQRSMSALVSGEKFSGRGAGGPSIDQLIAQKIGRDTRFRSLQVGVCQESFGTSIQRNMSWAAKDRPLPPELIPHRLFERLFGARDYGWIDRKSSILDAVSEQAGRLQGALGQEDSHRVEEYLASIRDMERAIAGLPEEYAKSVDEPEAGGDPKDYPAYFQAPDRSVGSCLGFRSDARCVLHAHQVPRLEPFPLAGIVVRKASRVQPRRRSPPRAPARDHARHLPLACAGVCLPRRQAQSDARGRRESARFHRAHFRPRARRSEQPQEQRPRGDRGRWRRTARHGPAHASRRHA